MEQIRASVAMAVYNGETYIREQVDSILNQLGEQDELVISYDKSTDSTKSIINAYAASDKRVRVVENTNGGVQNNFNNAVMHCRGEYIFLSDQDDLWLEGKVEKVLAAFAKTNADLVVHDGYFANEKLVPQEKTIFDLFGSYDNPLRNIVKCNYWGCCMAFRSDMRKYVCPFPNRYRVGHDWWIGIIIGFRGKIARVNECLILHRIHGNNQSETKRRPMKLVIQHRIALICYLLQHFLFGKIR